MATAVNGGVPLLSSQAYLESTAVKETRGLVSELCRQFYTLGWVSGTGGSITIKVHEDSIVKRQQLIVMSPSGVQKERMVPEDMYVLSASGEILCTPVKKPYPHRPPKCTDCAPLFMKAYEMRDAGAVIHSHGLESCLVTMLHPFSREFRITHMEMIKGIKGHGYHDELVIPIIENTAHEGELTESLAKAIEDYPKATAVLVRNHGVYVWGDSWINAKTQAECYHYLFEAALKLHNLGLDWSTPLHGSIHNSKGYEYTNRQQAGSVKAQLQNRNPVPEPSRHCIILDIEGTTTPISFVTDVLFPYARDNLRKHLTATYDSAETQDDIKLIRAQVKDDLEKRVPGSVPIPSEDSGKDDIIKCIVAGHIWRTGFENKELQGVVFDDVPEALGEWQATGIKVYIYSSGSREAQRLLFGNTAHGDLRKYLCGFFDTTIGGQAHSQILFLTDVYEEAVAAKAAGLEVIISVRPGNGPLPDNHGFTTVTSFTEV
ncbi:unnamed protein product [Spirodela intermedia]|uniref:Probable bifunctional methylthioribulose-1-phosphate dehydratase/enolase-phosphatase E1 n=1 Tax=Spirodela intermedia TaxID=51605 RepID=A0A7I8JMX6_SPIIN|nr:unnamed protein product [Spirodela intermedia]CAA6671498.1 unnamed protein product [Spirodela intermedia]